MSSEEPDLPVAAYEWRYVDWEDGHTVLRHDEPDRNSFDVELELVDELVKESDAEEAIRGARQEAKREERQKIREKIEEQIEYENGISTEEADRPAYAAHTLEILRDELEEEVDQS